MKRPQIIAAALGLLLMALGWILFGATPAQAQFGRATPTPRPGATSAPTATATLTTTIIPTATIIATATALLPTPTPPAFVLLPAPSVKEQLAGDIVTAPDALLSNAYPSVFGDRIGLAMANLRDTSSGNAAGDGIASVTFTVLETASGAVVHSSVAYAPPFCVFGTLNTGCATLDFGGRDAWPDGTPAQSGHYLLVAFAQGDVPTHKGVWTLRFEVRLTPDELQAFDGAARIRNVAQSSDGWLVTVESFGFAPLAIGTHLHLYAAPSAAAGADGPSGPIVEFPTDVAADAMQRESHSAEVLVPRAALRNGDRVLCVAVAHPDHTLLPERGECVALPY